MITNTGKSIIGKYMLGQAPAFASHIAIGSGRQPLDTTPDNLDIYQSEFSQKQSLDFEMFRVPIISRGYVTEPSSSPISITSAAGNGVLITYGTDTPHNLAPGDIVDISGTNVDDYNIVGAVVYTVTSSTAFTVQSTATGAYVSGGQVVDRITKLTLTAELPTEQRYEITEVGIYSARSNPSATNKDSRILYTFAETENWEYHGTTSAIGIGASISTPLTSGSSLGVINLAIGPTGSAGVFRATSDNAAFNTETRLSRYERCRFLNTAVYIPGSMSQLEMVGDELTVVDSGTEAQNKEFAKHIHLAGTSVNLSANSPEDELRLAFSVVNKDQAYTGVPTKVNLLVVFSPEEADPAINENFAKFQIEVTEDLNTNRYRVVSAKLGDLFTGTSFTWGAVSLIRIYASIFDELGVANRSFSAATQTATIITSEPHGYRVGSKVTVTGVNNSLFNGDFVITETTENTFGFSLTHPTDIPSDSGSGGTVEAPSDNFIIGLDALRLENLATLNPLYGLTGYTVIRTSDARPIIKEANSSNLVEFRFGLDVM